MLTCLNVAVHTKMQVCINSVLLSDDTSASYLRLYVTALLLSVNKAFICTCACGDWFVGKQCTFLLLLSCFLTVSKTKAAVVVTNTVLAQHDIDRFTHPHARAIMTYKISSTRDDT